tara:strand:+ start:242 stop:445 length:204 start_codon:yes stop_codon:yes gene_type:complete
MKNKFGSYIQKLMTVILDKTQEDFTRELAWGELNGIKDSVTEFLMKHREVSEKKDKQLLQEKKNAEK